MQRMIIIALLLDLSVGAFGTKCAAGHKHKDVLANVYCATSATDVASCDAACCVKNDKTCGGTAVTCPPFDQYAPSNDAWKNTKTTDKTKVADCCRPKVTCGNTLYSCPAGYKKKGNQFAKVKCSSDPASCAVGTLCCELNLFTCGGKTFPNCPAGQYKSIAEDAWKKIAVAGTGGANPTDTQYKAACCAAQPTCATVKCKAGYKADTSKAAQKPTANAATFTDAQLGYGGTPDANACCVKDTNKCGGTTPSCTAGTFYPGTDGWKNMPKTTCCTAVATCAAAKCPAGYKTKANVDKLSCSGNAASCTNDAALTAGTCCEKDTTKCGGLTGIKCAYGFYDESTTFVTTGDKKTPQATIDAWKNKPATEATKNTACCTAKALCKAEVVGTGTTTPAAAAITVTTTPAAAAITVTTTPAAPVRRYSEHKGAVEKGSDRSQGANMVWLGAGSLIGMAVLMAVQGLRSRMQVREVGDMLPESVPLV